MAEKFSNFYIDHVPRSQNAHADALASLAASLALPAGAMEKVFVYSHELYCPKISPGDYPGSRGDRRGKETLEVSTAPDLKDWRFPYIDFVLYGILPEDTKEAAAIRRKAPKFYYNAISRTLYRRSHDGILLRCLSSKEAQGVLKEAHDGTCGAHQPGPNWHIDSKGWVTIGQK